MSLEILVSTYNTFTPFTERLPYPFRYLKRQLIRKKFRESKFTIPITRKSFEQVISGIEELEMEYVEEYSRRNSNFYIAFLFPELKTHGFFVMTVKDQIRLVFYRELRI